MSQQIEQIERRTQRYWYDDGLVEMIIGLLFTLIGGLLYLQFMLSPGPVKAILLAGVMPVLVIAGTFLSKRLIERLKSRITYPRTGYVAYSRDQDKASKGRWVVVGFAAALSVVILALDIWLDDFTLNHMALGEGFLLAVIFAYLGYRFGLRRHYVVAGLGVGLGLGIPLSGIGEVPGSALVFGAAGLAMLVIGVVTLRAYLQNNPLPNGDHDET